LLFIVVPCRGGERHYPVPAAELHDPATVSPGQKGKTMTKPEAS
jgi:hypothetical protein